MRRSSSATPPGEASPAEAEASPVEARSVGCFVARAWDAQQPRRAASGCAQSGGGEKLARLDAALARSWRRRTERGRAARTGSGHRGRRREPEAASPVMPDMIIVA
jgi:hypothetical protein